jgi:ubiquinone/menaquinone biosynthesis C-methylase UbiE
MKLQQLTKTLRNKLPSFSFTKPTTKQNTKQQELISSTNTWQKQTSDKIWASQPLVNDLYQFIKPDSKILDLGCGCGEITSQIYDAGFNNLTGSDFNKHGIEAAQEKTKQRPGLSFQTGDATNLHNLENNSFDCIVSVGLWSAIVDSKKIVEGLKEAFRVLKPGGVLYIQDFRFRLDNLHPQYTEAILKGQSLGTVRSINRETRELRFLSHQFRQAEIKNLLKKAGFNNNNLDSRLS